MTKVAIMRSIPGSPVPAYGEPWAMVITLENGDRLTGSATEADAEGLIAFAKDRKGFNIRAEVMAALHEHQNPESILEAAE